MSDTEKNAQLGMAAVGYQKAKADLSQIETKLMCILRAYSSLGQIANDTERDRKADSELRLVHGELQADRTTVAGEDVVGYAALCALVMERDAARKRLKEAKQLMESLGLGDLS